jgi:hypothetical protein
VMSDVCCGEAWKRDYINQKLLCRQLLNLNLTNSPIFNTLPSPINIVSVQDSGGLFTESMGTDDGRR